MSDEKKDQNLPARQASSLMGQLVRQRQTEQLPAQPPPPGAQMARPQSGGGIAAGAPGSTAAPTAHPSRADIERVDARDEHEYGMPSEPVSEPSRFNTNQVLIRE